MATSQTEVDLDCRTLVKVNFTVPQKSESPRPVKSRDSVGFSRQRVTLS